MEKGPELESIHPEQFPTRDPGLDRMERGGIWWDRLRSVGLPIAVAGTVVTALIAGPSIAIRLGSPDYMLKDMMAKLNEEKPLLPNEKRFGPAEAVEDWVIVTNYPDLSQVLGSIPRGTKIDGSIRQAGKVVAYCGSIPGLAADARKLCAINYDQIAVTKTPDKEETPSPDSLAVPEPVGFYNGTFQITIKLNGESINIGTAPIISERKIIPWDKIVSLEGIGVGGSNVLSVQNPLLVEGDNPTFDPGRFPSMWMVFRAKVLVDKYPRTVEEMKLYLNISQETILSGHVQPDATPWDENIVPLDPGVKMPALTQLNIVR